MTNVLTTEEEYVLGLLEAKCTGYGWMPDAFRFVHQWLERELRGNEQPAPPTQHPVLEDPHVQAAITVIKQRTEDLNVTECTPVELVIHIERYRAVIEALLGDKEPTDTYEQVEDIMLEALDVLWPLVETSRP